MTSVGAVSEASQRRARRIPIGRTVRAVSPGRAETDRTACLVISDRAAMPCAAPGSSQTCQGCPVAGRTRPARTGRAGEVVEEAT